MSRKAPANVGIHTSAAEIENRIVEFLKRGRCRRVSAIGYAAYQGYTFRSPQGAAFAVQSHLQRLVKLGVVGWWGGDHEPGYYLTGKSLDECR